MDVMGGVAFVLGLIGLAVATAIWINANLSRRLDELARNHCTCPTVNGEDRTLALIKGDRF